MDLDQHPEETMVNNPIATRLKRNPVLEKYCANLEQSILFYFWCKYHLVEEPNSISVSCQEIYQKFGQDFRKCDSKTKLMNKIAQGQIVQIIFHNAFRKSKRPRGTEETRVYWHGIKYIESYDIPAVNLSQEYFAGLPDVFTSMESPDCLKIIKKLNLYINETKPYMEYTMIQRGQSNFFNVQFRDVTLHMKLWNYLDERIFNIIKEFIVTNRLKLCHGSQEVGLIDVLRHRREKIESEKLTKPEYRLFSHNCRRILTLIPWDKQCKGCYDYQKHMVHEKKVATESFIIVDKRDSSDKKRELKGNEDEGESEADEGQDESEADVDETESEADEDEAESEAD